MKDIVENRKLLSFAQKIRIAKIALKENGAWWCLLLLVYLTSSSLAHKVFGAMDRHRRTKNIPGINSRALNKEIWESWNWSAAGEEWSQSVGWKRGLIRSVLQQTMPRQADILEVGPGAGRWTESLLDRSRTYVGVDISSTCVAHCQKRFAAYPNAKFLVGSGSDLNGVADGAVDAIWSFDVFVHINRAEFDSYLGEFARVLKAGGLAVIHHGTVGGAQGGWRSNLLAGDLSEMLDRHGFEVKETVSSWTDEDAVHRFEYGDVITVFGRRTA
jgi:ubiquinone/menaquinone biosynthesis C-methylase UbiE